MAALQHALQVTCLTVDSNFGSGTKWPPCHINYDVSGYVIRSISIGPVLGYRRKAGKLATLVSIHGETEEAIHAALWEAARVHPQVHVAEPMVSRCDDAATLLLLFASSRAESISPTSYLISVRNNSWLKYSVRGNPAGAVLKRPVS